MPRPFDSLAVRIGAVFVLGLVALQLTILATVLWPDGRPAVFRLVSPGEAAAMARALEAATPDQQALIVEALNGGALIVELRRGFPLEPRSDAGARRGPWLERQFRRYAAELEGRPFRVEARREARLGLGPGRIGAPGAVRLLVQIADGQVLVVQRAPVLLQRIVARFALIAGAAALILLVVMVVCMQQVAWPVDRLARAARRFAHETATADIRPQGAREVRDLAGAFNEMKHTIRDLLDERTRILAAIAHDLRTYLTRLRLRTEFIDDPHQRERAVQDLEEMSLLIDDAVMFARDATVRDDAGAERFDLNAEVAAFTALRQEIGDPVSASLAGTPAPVRAARLAVRRILANLCDNAVRYGGVARISVAATAEGVRLAVDDDGPGAPADALDRLTAPFERLEPSRGRQTGGAGLGLAIVKALAESQGGRLTLENRPEGGLRASVLLPSAAER